MGGATGSVEAGRTEAGCATGGEEPTGAETSPRPKSIQLTAKTVNTQTVSAHHNHLRLDDRGGKGSRSMDT
jgi:hypothetical protein